MGCYSSSGGLHSQVLHFYVLVFPINIQKCLVITRLGFIYMQSASVDINCSGKVPSVRFLFISIIYLCSFSYPLLLLFISSLLFSNIEINRIISFDIKPPKNNIKMRNLRFIYFNNLHEHQTPACYVNAIPLKRVGKNLRWLIYIVK